MSSTSFHTRYRLISALSVLLIASNVSTLMHYGAEGNILIKLNHIAPPGFAVITSIAMSRMLSTPHSDPEKSTRRLPSTYNKLMCLLLMWVTLCTSALRFPSRHRPLAPRLSRARAACVSSPFRMKCIPLGVDVVLLFSIIIALYSTSRAFRRRVSELYSTRLSFLNAAVVGETNTIDDASTAATTAIAKPEFLPAWMAEDLLRNRGVD
ncbi:hypothetical protein B0H19DRAFT_1133907 [Mycena capillaripes]|nr:hypothetical protein B0H19DRAFT_1133907 [Mycena capillaripes]